MGTSDVLHRILTTVFMFNWFLLLFLEYNAMEMAINCQRTVLENMKNAKYVCCTLCSFDSVTRHMCDTRTNYQADDDHSQQ